MHIIRLFSRPTLITFWTAKGTLKSVKLLSIEIKPRELNMVFGGDTYPAQLFTDVSWQRGD